MRSWRITELGAALMFIRVDEFKKSYYKNRGIQGEWASGRKKERNFSHRSFRIRREEVSGRPPVQRWLDEHVVQQVQRRARFGVINRIL